MRATRLFDDFDEIFAARKAEADEFYDAVAPVNLTCRIQGNSTPGPGWAALDQAVLLLHRGAMA